jgi:hypothetical protein
MTQTLNVERSFMAISPCWNLCSKHAQNLVGLSDLSRAFDEKGRTDSHKNCG